MYTLCKNIYIYERPVSTHLVSVCKFALRCDYSILSEQTAEISRGSRDIIRTVYTPPRSHVAQQSMMEHKIQDGFLPCGDVETSDRSLNWFTTKPEESGKRENCSFLRTKTQTTSHNKQSLSFISAVADGILGAGSGS